MNDFEFENDQIFCSLKSFAAAPVDAEMPLHIKEAFVSARKQVRIRKYGFRGLLGILTISIALPALAAANVLPPTVKHFVQSAQHNAVNTVKHLVSPASVIKDAIQGKEHDEKTAEEDQPAQISAVAEDQEDEVITGSKPTEKPEDSKGKSEDSKGKEKKSANLIAASPAPSAEDDESDQATNNDNNGKALGKEKRRNLSN